ncbi:hypothetical protein WJX79_007444 [Trebouxia sp. C0005]
MDVSGQAQTFRSQRKRKRISYSSDGLTESPADDKGLESLLNLAQGCTKLLVFSGSGLSAGSGMSTFSTKGGLYERAQKRFNVSNGKRLFTYSFYEKRKLEALAFFADIYAEARKAKPGLGHRALAQVAGAHKLLRHYTMNIDGLAEAAGMDTWHVDNNPAGQTVEMHGNINQLVCPSCGVVVMMTPALLRKLRSKKPVPCTKCNCRAIRCRIMLYDDAEDDVITPEDVFDIMEEDVQQADLIVWVGISFEQSASTAYFRRVRQYLMEGKRQDLTRQAIINTTEEAFWNLKSACSNTGAMDVLEPMAPLERHVASSTPGTHADDTRHEQQQRQEQRHLRARMMPAGTPRRTIAPAYMPNREIEQGLGQFDAPLYQQNAGVGSVVGPTEILPLGQMARQREPDLHGQGQDAPGPGDAPQTQGSDTHGQWQGPSVPESQGHDASNPGIGAEYQGGVYVNDHVGGAHGPGQNVHRAAPNASGQDQDRPGPSASSQSKQPADRGTDVVNHSGVLEDSHFTAFAMVASSGGSPQLLS